MPQPQRNVRKIDPPAKILESIEEVNANGGTHSKDAPEPGRRSSRPDKHSSGSAR